MRKFGFALLGLLIFAATPLAYAAARLGPPIEELQKNPERIRIVVATATEKPGPGKIRFSINEALSGQAPEEVVLRTDTETAGDVEVGGSYIVAWTYQRRNRGVVGGWEEDPDGPATVQILGLGTTALFVDSPELRLLFSGVKKGDAIEPSRQIDALLAQMKRNDSHGRGLAAAQLYLRPDLTKQMDAAQVDAMKKVLQGEALDPQQRDLLLRSAMSLPRDKTSPWLGEEFRRIIIENGTQYDLKTFVPSLVRTAARGLRQAGTPADVNLLSILLYANNPGVSRAALESMDHLDQRAAIASAEKAVGRDWIHMETRRILQNYLRKTGS